MTNTAKKYKCNHCDAVVRRIGKHVNRYHLYDIGHNDGFGDRMFNNPVPDKPEYGEGFHEGHMNS